MPASKARLLRIGHDHLAAAHAFAERGLDRELRDRQAVEACIDALSDAGLGRLADLFSERSRAYVAVNTLSAVRALTGHMPQLRFDPAGSAWWIVMHDRNFPLGVVAKDEMDRALDAAGLEGVPELH